MSQTMTQTVTLQSATQKNTVFVDDLAREQFLAQEFDVVNKLREESKKETFKPQWVWRNIALFAALHFGALIGLYQILFVAKWQTFIWSLMVWSMCGLGVTMGAHRLWAHKSYKAKLPLKIILVIWQSMAFQNHVIEWSRDHRCHHKWTDTDADPHNVNRGFFFSHMGWLLQRKHPKIREMGAKLDLSDLESDPVLAFQKKYYLPMVLLFCFLLPTAVAVYGWGEAPLVAFYTAAIWRYCWTLHMTWFINSVAHMFGYRPYDVAITPVESTWTTILAFGEGAHNYHHTFPQDYRASEMSYMLNFTRFVIEAFAKIGWAYDLNQVGDEIIKRQKAKQTELVKEKAM